MKSIFNITILAFVLSNIFLACTLKDEEQDAGVSITGNTGKISGVVMDVNAQSLRKVSLADEGGYLAVLTSESEGFEPESLYIGDRRDFVFDSLPVGNYHVTLIQQDSVVGELDGIELRDGEYLKVVLYIGENAPPSTWESVTLGWVKIHVPDMQEPNVYLISNNGFGTLKIPANARDSLTISLPAGNYRAVVHSDYESNGGMVTEIQTFDVNEGTSQVIGFEIVDSLQFSQRIPDRTIPNRFQQVTYRDSFVVWEGYFWTGYQSQRAGVRFFDVHSYREECEFGKTIYVKSSELPLRRLIVDESGTGIQIEQTGEPGEFLAPVHIYRLDSNGFRWDLTTPSEYNVIPKDSIKNMPPINSNAVTNIQMIVVYKGDTILAVQESGPYAWNNIQVLYVIGHAHNPIPGMPNLGGLWLHYRWNGYNLDGDTWGVESNGDEELRIVDYPRTGDTLSGIQYNRVYLNEDVNEYSFGGARNYSNDSVQIMLKVDAPLMKHIYPIGTP